MENNTYDVTAARGGAVFTGVGSPWISLSAPGMSYVPVPNPAPAAAAQNAHLGAFRQIPAMTQAAALAAALPSATDIRKQYVHKTRVNAGGDGASGPHPERVPV